MLLRDSRHELFVEPGSVSGKLYLWCAYVSICLFGVHAFVCMHVYYAFAYVCPQTCDHVGMHAVYMCVCSKHMYVVLCMCFMHVSACIHM